MTTSASATTSSKRSSATGMAALADRPSGPFLVTRETVAPVRRANASAAAVITTSALGLPLSSTAIRSPARDDGDGARCAGSGPGMESGRYTDTVISTLHGQRDAAGHAPRRDDEGMLPRSAGHDDLDVVGLAGHRE